MTFTEAAEAVLRKVGKPLHYKKITELAIQQNLLSHIGKTPETTMSTRLATLTKKDRGDAAIVRVKPGVFGLRDWGNAVESGESETESEGDDETTTEAAAAEAAVAPAAVSERPAPAPDEQERAVRMAAAAQLFPQEDDDDEPVMAEKPAPAPAPLATEGEKAAADADRSGAEGGRRRRRRRRRGRGERPEGATAAGLDEAGEGELEGEGEGELEGAAGEDRADEALQPNPEAGTAAVASDPDDEPLLGLRGEEPEVETESARRERFDRNERDRDRPERGERDNRDNRGDRGERGDRDRREMRRDRDEVRDEVGRDGADLLVSLLTRRDERQPVPLRVLVDDALRSGRVQGDATVIAASLAAAARVDGLRREARGERPRLRIAGGRVGLVDWSLGSDVVRAESDALIALERLRDAARRQLVRRFNELPQSGFTELLLLLLEKMGLSGARMVRRPGLPQGEVHVTAVARRAGEEVRTAVILKRGGEIGRERVIELRGSMHHYGNAVTAWIITTGNVLSGARDEAVQPGASPMTLIDGVALGRLLDEHGVGVRHTTVPVPYLDADLFDALRG